MAWDEVPELDRNGIITMYEIEYWKMGDQDNSNNVTVGPAVFIFVLNGLEDFQIYVVHVRAYTMVGAGPYSEPVTAEPEQNGL